MYTFGQIVTSEGKTRYFIRYEDKLLLSIKYYNNKLAYLIAKMVL